MFRFKQNENPSSHIVGAHPAKARRTPLQSVSVRIQKKYLRNAPDHDDPICKPEQSPNPNQIPITIPSPELTSQQQNQLPQVTPQKPETPPTYPFPAYSIVKQQFRPLPPPANEKGTVSGTSKQPMPKAWSAFYSRQTHAVNNPSHKKNPQTATPQAKKAAAF